MTLEQFRQYCLAKKGVEETTPFNEDTLVMKVSGKIFAITDMNEFDRISVKVDPEYGAELKERYSSILPAYHMNKKHWISILIDGKIGDSMLSALIDSSYGLVVSNLNKSDRLSMYH